jgi:hypothetical protein
MKTGYRAASIEKLHDCNLNPTVKSGLGLLFHPLPHSPSGRADGIDLALFRVLPQIL